MLDHKSTFISLLLSLRLSFLGCSTYLLFFFSPALHIPIPIPDTYTKHRQRQLRAAMYTVRWARNTRTQVLSVWWRATGGMVLASPSASNGNMRADCGTRRCWKNGRLPLHLILLYQRRELRLHHHVSSSKILC